MFSFSQACDVASRVGIETGQVFIGPSAQIRAQARAQVTRGFEPTAQVAPGHFAQGISIARRAKRIRAEIMRAMRQEHFSFEHAAVINQQPSRSGKAALNQRMPSRLGELADAGAACKAGRDGQPHPSRQRG